MKKPDSNMTNSLASILSSDIKVRITAARKNISIFTSVYLNHYLDYKMAPMHKEMLALAQNPDIRLTVIMGFRDSGKSTIMSLIYPIWAVIGVQQKKCVVIFSQTQPQAKRLFGHIRDELEDNELLRAELGPFELYEDEWGNSTIELSRYGAKIIAASVDESIRGVRNGKYRPDLTILDDVEDLQSVRTAEGREKLRSRFTGVIMPLGNHTTGKIVIVGGRLHDESLLSRLANSIEAGKRPGVVRSYPIVDDNGQPLWPDKFPDQASIETLKNEIEDEVAYQREFMLKVITPEDEVVDPDWIHTYTELPAPTAENEFRGVFAAADLAISDNGAFTAIVVVYLYGYDKDMRIYVEANPFNMRIGFPDQAEVIKATYNRLSEIGSPNFYIESVGYQLALIQHLRDEGYQVERFDPRGENKLARLAITSPYIKNGTILFPERGAEVLTHQMTNFISEKYKDVADAFAMNIIKVLEQKRHVSGFPPGYNPNDYKRVPFFDIHKQW